MSRYGERTRVGTSRKVAGLGKAPSAGIGYGVATGGTAISPDPSINGIVYRVLQFTSDDNLVVTKAGLFDVLMFGGGGAGGAGYPSDTRFTGGGGGAGGKFQSTVLLSAATYAVDVGAGGAGASDAFSGAAFDTEIGGLIAGVAGGRGGYYDDNSRFTSDRAEKGGSGGGGTSGNGVAALAVAGLRVISQGNIGGVGITTPSTNSGSGGGGGAGAVGNAGTALVGGDGGAGVEVNTFIGGASLFKAGGGGGARPASSGGAGGSSIGGAGTSSANGNGSNAAANTASGGGGANGSGTSGNGGSGIVYVRFVV